MRLSRALLCAGLLMAAAARCAGATCATVARCSRHGSGSGCPDVLVEQPTLDDAEAPRRIIGEVRPDGEKFLVRIANMGRDAELAAVTWDVGQYTGFRPAAGDQLGPFQRGPVPSGGDSATARPSRCGATKSVSGSIRIIPALRRDR